jgi:hypothetical protein
MTIAFFAFIACTTVGKAHLQAIGGWDLQVNPSIAVQLQKVELLYVTTAPYQNCVPQF